MALEVKKLTANAGDLRNVGREDLLEEGMATYSSLLAWRISRTEEPGGLQSDTTKVSKHACMHRFIIIIPSL